MLEAFGTMASSLSIRLVIWSLPPSRMAQMDTQDECCKLYAVAVLMSQPSRPAGLYSRLATSPLRTVAARTMFFKSIL